MYSKGAYSKLPYSKGIFLQTLSQSLSATAIAKAALSYLPIFLMVMAATVTAIASRANRGAQKFMCSTTKATPKVVRRVLLLTMTATAEGVAYITGSIKALYRSLAATTKGSATVLKAFVIGTALLATAKARPYYLLIQKVYGWIYTGLFGPGQRIIVDRDTLSATKDGSNVLHEIEGAVPFLEPGNNTVTYSDTSTGRNIDLVIRYKGRWL